MSEQPMRGGRPKLRPPYPYSGGKGLWAAEINRRLGSDVMTYAEPFAGSLSVLLSREPAKREVICDTSSLLVNAIRSMIHAPDDVAYWCDYGTYHDDLIARRKWLGRWVAEHAPRVQDDPDWCDPKAGGWWVWVVSHAIRPGNVVNSAPTSAVVPHCSSPGRGVQAGRVHGATSIPHSGGGRGVQAQRVDVGVPRMASGASGPGANGVQAQRAGFTHGFGAPARKIPRMKGGGQGVQAQRMVDHGDDTPKRPSLRDKDAGSNGVQAHGRTTEAGGLPSSERWGPWFHALARRLKQVVVLNRPWESAVTPAVLAAAANGQVAILLDPPYVTSGRSKLYESDENADQTNAVAEASYRWAVRHGSRYRIAYAMTEGSFVFPGGWTVLSRRYTGPNAATRTRDAIAFSPSCLRP